MLSLPEQRSRLVGFTFFIILIKINSMKLYKQQPEKMIRLQITKQGEETKYINLCDTDAKETESFLKNLITSQKISPFENGRSTSIVTREAIGGKNGKSKSISFKGLSPKQVYDLIIKKVS